MNPTHYNDIYKIIRKKTLSCQKNIKQACLGLTWTFCEIHSDEGSSLGFAQSPGISTRTLEWPGTVSNQPVSNISSWLNQWNFHQATVGLAACNAIINSENNRLLNVATLIESDGQHNLAIFEHFKSKLRNKKVIIIGRYPGLDSVLAGIDYKVVEKNPGPNDLPDSASEYLLAEADWVFITATSLINKTFPRLAELSKHAVSVLMGPSMPWLEEFSDFNIDYLAGIKVTNKAKAIQIAMEGGGTRLFDEGVTYAIADISEERLKRTQNEIAESMVERQSLKDEMEAWYETGNVKRFPKRSALEEADKKLSTLDSAYKRLWDARLT